MSDLVTRLRNWRDVHLARLHILMEEAADGIERLSGSGDCPTPDNSANADNTPAAHDTPSEGIEQDGCTLTDAEREAVKMGINACEQIGQYQHWADRINEQAAATLRGLLARLGGER